QAFYMEVVFVKVWERNKFIEVEEPRFLDSVVKEFRRSVIDMRYWIATVELEETKNPIKKIGLKVLRKTTTKNSS
ncbi:MAG TPA: hypothetical protein VHE53_02150, partial [Patescibacteria group bacterium]|nr:hypothetical protein [Patescibacteria group bacterium]